MSTLLHLVPNDVDPYQATGDSSQAAEDPALRPTTFADYIGQDVVVSGLREAIRAAKREGWQLDHQLFAGPPGLGKTSLALIVAAEMGAKLHVTSAPAIVHKGALASLLTTLQAGDVLFIDELHALSPEIAECLYTAMEDQVIDMPGKRVIRVHLQKFTLLGATTNAGKLSQPLRERFGFIWTLQSYTLSEMTTIIERSARKLGVEIDEEGALVIARTSRGTPRIANRHLRRVRDSAANAAADGALVMRGTRTGKHGTISGPLATAALAQLGIDHRGLAPLDRRYLELVAERPVGIEALSAALAEDRRTLEETVEPFLMQTGLVQRGGRGRLATEAGRQHLAEAREVTV